MIYIARNVSISVYAISFADYVLSLVPGLNHTLISILLQPYFCNKYISNKIYCKGTKYINDSFNCIIKFIHSIWCRKGTAGYFSDPNYF